MESCNLEQCRTMKKRHSIAAAAIIEQQQQIVFRSTESLREISLLWSLTRRVFWSCSSSYSWECQPLLCPHPSTGNNNSSTSIFNNIQLTSKRYIQRAYVVRLLGVRHSNFQQMNFPLANIPLVLLLLLILQARVCLSVCLSKLPLAETYYYDCILLSKSLFL